MQVYTFFSLNDASATAAMDTSITNALPKASSVVMHMDHD